MRFILAVLLVAVAGSAQAQPVTQQNSVLYCATGQYDAFGNPIVTPCGFAGSPVQVTQVPNNSAQQVQPVTSCPPNPLSKKIPPLC